MQSYILSGVGLHKEKHKGEIFACDFNSTHHFTLMSMFIIHRDGLKQDSCFIIIRSHVSMHLDGTHLGERF